MDVPAPGSQGIPQTSPPTIKRASSSKPANVFISHIGEGVSPKPTDSTVDLSSVQNRSTIPPRGTAKTIREAKDAEYEGVYQAMKSVAKTTSFAKDGKQIDAQYIDGVTVNSLVQVMVKKRQRNGIPFDTKDLPLLKKAAVKFLANIDIPPKDSPPLPGEELDQDWLKETLGKVRKNVSTARKHLQSQSKELHSIVSRLITLLDSAKDHKTAAKEALQLMRKAYRSEAYRFLCSDETNPDIHFLHNIALASLVEPAPLDAYERLGVIDPSKNEGGFANNLASLRDTGIKAGFTASHNTADYFFHHPINTFSSLKSETGGQYDPRAETGNLTGSLYDEEVTPQDKSKPSVHRRTVYTPTPTIGNSISPETHLVLKALENRNFMTPQDLAKDRFPYKNWVFTNLQDLSSKGESGRAKAIMQLNTEYPLSFTGLTISVDSPFYKDGIHGSNAKKFAEQKGMSANVPLDETYRDNMKTELKKEYYSFPIPVGISREKFLSDVGSLVDQAYKVINEIKPPSTLTTDAEKKAFLWQQKAAFRELVSLGIIRYWQCKGSQKNSANVLCSNVCKECIDRGSTKNSALLWALGGEEKDVLRGLLGRALLARYRLILPDRLEPFVSLAGVVEAGGKSAFEKMQSFLRTGVDSIAGAPESSYGKATSYHTPIATVTSKTMPEGEK